MQLFHLVKMLMAQDLLLEGFYPAGVQQLQQEKVEATVEQLLIFHQILFNLFIPIGASIQMLTIKTMSQD